MDNYCAVQLSSCVKDELILLKANMPYLYAYLLTDEQYQEYLKCEPMGMRFPKETPIGLNAPCDGTL